MAGLTSEVAALTRRERVNLVLIPRWGRECTRQSSPLGEGVGEGNVLGSLPHLVRLMEKGIY